MFSGFWSFIGCLIVLFIMASVFQFLFEKILEFITILLRGYPPAPQITCPREEKNKEG
jgi:ABC-type polysaccharide/polyol phosphate export permease